MNNLLLSLVDGNDLNIGTGAIIALVSIIMVFAILALIILITWLVNKGLNKIEANKAVASPVEERSTQRSVEIKDDDMMAAVLVASIDYRAQTQKSIKVLNVKEIK